MKLEMFSSGQGECADMHKLVPENETDKMVMRVLAEKECDEWENGESAQHTIQIHELTSSQFDEDGKIDVLVSKRSDGLRMGSLLEEQQFCPAWLTTVEGKYWGLSLDTEREIEITFPWFSESATKQVNESEVVD